MTSRRLLLIAPGRGSYAADELGFLARRLEMAEPGSTAARWIESVEEDRRAWGRVSLVDLDAAPRFSPAKHLPGPNAGPMIFLCSAVDQSLIPDSAGKTVGVIGNSMGWYTALALGGALDFRDAHRLVDTMASAPPVGGQLIVPWVNGEWCPDADEEARILGTVSELQRRGARVWVSIRLGGYFVLAGDESGLTALEERLPKRKVGRHTYPFRLAFHAAFHTPLVKEASERGLEALSDLAWRRPRIPLVDGQGRLYSPFSTSVDLLEDYTLVDQVLSTFDFTLALRMALRELQPDLLVLLGPGATLGGAIAQVLIQEHWRGIRSKSDFQAIQGSEEPVLLSMGRADQFDRLMGL
ncbi:MAG TPA: ACP S-malonyltransferase [Planctomycetes bacterium]|nr:ACP S-malonyltransferase [Planctomycetota bacterium]